MRIAERATPVAAVIAAFSTLACCLPFGFLGAIGLAGASVRLQTARPWLLVGSLVLLVLGFVQLYRRWEAMQKAESAQRCAVLGRCRSSSPDCSFSPTHSELSCWLSDLSCG